ncbi:hypothetical protein, partial [Actinomadura sp. RB99]|uniref:hypothetical protein n=1 Tax=Actinomadura sp. RB99 TaxID=2691577 RepID=UPI0019D6A1AC
ATARNALHAGAHVTIAARDKTRLKEAATDLGDNVEAATVDAQQGKTHYLAVAISGTRESA